MNYWRIVIIILILLIVIGSIYVFWPVRQGNEKLLLSVENTASTNFLGYKLNIFIDGSGEIYMGDPTMGRISNVPIHTFPKGTFNINLLDYNLTKINNVSIPPTYLCVKSVSFGTSTYLIYRGHMSGDIQCIQNKYMQNIYNYIDSLKVLQAYQMMH